MNLIQLRDGPLVREDAVRLALELEEAGHALTVSESVLTVTQGSTLTAEQRAHIATLRFHLMALAGYAPPEAR